MDNSKELIINALINYFEVNGWPYEVNYQKLMERYWVSSEESEPGWKIVEIERHRSILGGNYTQGCRMSSFETYSMRYAIDVSTLEVKELPKKHIKYSIDIYEIACDYLERESFDLTIDPIDDARYKISELVNKEFGIVSNLEEAKEFMTRFIDGNVQQFERMLDINERPFNDFQKTKYLSAFTESIKEVLLMKAEYAWDDRDQE